MRRNKRGRRIVFAGIACAVGLATGCARHTPTVAHVHVGHAITGAHDTPDKDGYFVVAEKRASEALAHAERAILEEELEALKASVENAVRATDSEKAFGVKQALGEAGNHVTFAALSPDATANIKASAMVFNRDIAAVIDRCELISVLGNDVYMASSREEGRILAGEIVRLARANVLGADSNGDGMVGSTPEEYGLAQLRNELDVMVKREDPPYETVDRWYLFNLVRLPSGDWVFRKWMSGGASWGYK